MGVSGEGGERRPIGLRERKKAATRDAIYEAAVSLFRETGYDETTVDEIASAAGVSRATVFNYYGSKQALLVEYRRRLGDELREMAGRLLDAPDAGESDARSRVEAYFSGLARLAEREGELYRSLVRQVITRPSSGDDGLRERSEHAAAALAAALEAGRETGDVRRDLDAEFAAYTLLRLWTSALVEWAISGGRVPLEEQLDDMVDLLFTGLSS